MFDYDSVVWYFVVPVVVLVTLRSPVVDSRCCPRCDSIYVVVDSPPDVVDFNFAIPHLRHVRYDLPFPHVYLRFTPFTDWERYT